MPMPALAEMPVLDFYVLQGEVHLLGDKGGVGRLGWGWHANELLRGREYAQSYSTVKTMPRSCKEMRKLR